MNIIRQPFRYQNNGAVYWLIGINILVFMAMYFLGLRRLTYYLSMIPGLVMRGWVWTFVTYMFVHGGFSHILFNMFALFIFGVQVERYMGSREFLLFYFVTGTLAGIFSFCVYYVTGAYGVILMGASGAIFAVELAYAVFYPDSIIYLWGILPLRAPVMVLGFTALELASSVFGLNRGVAHLTHLAGFGFAWIYFLIRLNINPWKRLRMR
ncbi:MAG: rhomboid family intramembrane serine protease [Treponema sp.]|jgi:membrane associated rhomboid family serine protease|nr:rhomboid family intramembrane serine protease [Treponema sp.]